MDCGLQRFRIPHATVVAAITIGFLLSGCSGFGCTTFLNERSPCQGARSISLYSAAGGSETTSPPIHDDDYCDDTFKRSRHNVGTTLRVETKFILLETKHPGNVGSSARSMKTMGFTEGLVIVRPNDQRVLGRKKCKEAASGALDVLEDAFVVVDGDDDDDEDYDDGNNVAKTKSNATSLVDRALELAFGDTDTMDRHDNGNAPIIVCGTGMPVDMGRERVSQRYVEPRVFFRGLVGQRSTSTIPGDVATTTTTNENDRVIRIAFLFGNEKYGMTPQDMARCDVMLGIPTNPEFGSLNLATAVQIIAYDWRQALGGFSSLDS